jgi:hypothetical protein
MINFRETSSLNSRQINPKKRKLESSSFYKANNETNESNTENEFYYIYESKKKQLCTNLKIYKSIILSTEETQGDIEYALKPIGKSVKLFDMCLRFISLNLEAVDTFIGIPSQVTFSSIYI